MEKVRFSSPPPPLRIGGNLQVEYLAMVTYAKLWNELHCYSMLVKEWGLEETLPHHTTTWNVLLLLVQKHRNKHSTQHMFISNGTVGSSSALFRSMVQANKGHGTMSTIILGRNSPYKCSIFKWLLEMKQYMAYYFPSYNRRLKFPFAVTEW